MIETTDCWNVWEGGRCTTIVHIVGTPTLHSNWWLFTWLLCCECRHWWRHEYSGSSIGTTVYTIVLTLRSLLCWGWRHWWRHRDSGSPIATIVYNRCYVAGFEWQCSNFGFAKPAYYTYYWYMLRVAMQPFFAKPAYYTYYSLLCCRTPIATIVYMIVYIVGTVAKDHRKTGILHLLLLLGPSFSCPAFSYLATWPVIFTSCDFTSCIFSAPS